ncbi:MAG: tyrosine recombinase [Clostridiales bacterium]|nr:tyrosine recombinase [Candidatus Equinaster intestinalis]
MVSYVNEFENYLRDVKKSSKNTLESYMRDVAKFIVYCGEKRLKDPSAVTSEFVTKYEQYMLSVGQSESSVARTVASLRCYFNFLVKENYLSTTPVVTLSKRTTPKKLPEILTSKEVITLLEQPSGNDYKSCRDKAMLELLYATGIRVTELIELKVSDLNLQIGVIHMSGDKKKDRIIPLYPQALKTIKHYVTEARPVMISDPDEERLFTNMSGQPMTRQGFWKIIKHYASAAKINKDITPHTLRHSFAAHLLENGAQLTDVQELLGHSDISSTQVYAQMMKNKYAAAYKKFHPLAR